MENQMETGKKEMVKKEENSGSMFRRSVKVEISPADVENTECGQLPKPVNQEPCQPASSRIVMNKEEISDNWSTMAVPEMPLSISRKSLSENSRKKKMQETRSCQPSKAMKFVNGALVDTYVSSVRSSVLAVPGTTFISSSPLKAGTKAKPPATIESSPIKVNSIGSSPDTGSNNNSILESGSEDHNDGGSDVDEDMNETGQLTCLDCTAVLETDAAFKKHIASHKGYRRFKCTVCQKRFTRRDTLKVHMRRHEGGKQFKCDVCRKKFTTNSEVTAHKRIHTGDRPFECPICQKRFYSSGNLHKHKVIHTGKKTFKCDVCKKGFSENGSLTKHKRIHTGNKPYKCDVCKKCFTQNGSLKMHKLIHTGEKPYKCQTCGQCFRHNCSLKAHRRTQHSDADAGSQLDAGMDQSSTIDACDPLDNSVNGQKILYKRKSIDYVVEKMASINQDKFTMELASAVARSGYNCILCVNKIQPQPFRGVVKLSNRIHICLVEVGPDSTALRLFSFGGMILPEKITNHGTFKSLAKLESKMRRFSQSEGMEMVNIFKHSKQNSGWYRSLRDGLKGDCIITDKI